MRRLRKAIFGSGSRNASNNNAQGENEPVEDSSPSDARRSKPVRRRRVAKAGVYAALDPHIDVNLSAEKKLADFRELPEGERHLTDNLKSYFEV